MLNEVRKNDFNIAGVLAKDINIPSYDDVPLEDIVSYKTDETLKMVGYKKNHGLSSANISKLQLASSINEDEIVLYDFSKGLNEKEIKYFKLLFKKIIKYGKKIILISNDIDFLSDICDIFIVYDKKVIYKTNSIFDVNLYNFVDMPNILRFEKLARNKGLDVDYTLDINELLKDIYRRIHES